jgi:hypothetical protein
MCSLRFEKNFSLSNVFASLQKLFSFYLMCSLRFKNNLHTVGRVRFAYKRMFLLSIVKGVVPPRTWTKETLSTHTTAFLGRNHGYVRKFLNTV